jgi:RAB protein geranylgeranyltransferase component A
VSSKVYRQLEFLAVGSWWVYSAGSNSSVEEGSSSTGLHGRLLKVPNGREDVFQDQALDFKAKRALMKFLRFIAQYEEQTEVWQEHRSQPFPAFLTEQFKVPATLQAPLLALTLSSVSASQTTTEYALPRIARHLRSIGVFGAGFGAVIPKWGGMSEIAQVACRACAVGGGVYVLGKGLQEVYADAQQDGRLRLEDGEALTAKWIVSESSQSPKQEAACCKSTTIVASPLTPLFAPTAEEAPPPASVVVVFPSGSLSLGVELELDVEIPPVYVFVHSSDTGECPNGQSKSPIPFLHPCALMMINSYEYLSTLSELH